MKMERWTCSFRLEMTITVLGLFIITWIMIVSSLRRRWCTQIRTKTQGSVQSHLELLSGTSWPPLRTTTSTSEWPLRSHSRALIVSSCHTFTWELVGVIITLSSLMLRTASTAALTKSKSLLQLFQTVNLEFWSTPILSLIGTLSCLLTQPRYCW